MLSFIICIIALIFSHFAAASRIPTAIKHLVSIFSGALLPLDFSYQVGHMGPVRAHVDKKYVMLTGNMSR